MSGVLVRSWKSAVKPAREGGGCADERVCDSEVEEEEVDEYEDSRLRIGLGDVDGHVTGWATVFAVKKRKREDSRSLENKTRIFSNSLENRWKIVMRLVLYSFV
jgi:hypothetical protein